MTQNYSAPNRGNYHQSIDSKLNQPVLIAILSIALLALGLLALPRQAHAQSSAAAATSCGSAGSHAELVTAINCFRAATDPGQYTITFTDNISLTANLPNVDNDTAGISLLIAGNGFALDAQNDRRAIRIFADTHATFDRLTVMNGRIATGANILNSGTLTLTNSTVTGGTASNVAAGINNFNATLTLINSTIAGNTAGNNGGGIRSGGGRSHVTLINSIVANNAGGDCNGIINVSRNSLFGDDTCDVTGGVNGNISNVDAKLAPLAEVDGSLVYALLSGSPAHGGGEVASCPAIDQRGATRSQPAGSVCDMGSYESDLASVIEVSKSAENAIHPTGHAIAYTVLISNTGDAAIAQGVVNDILPAGLTLLADTLQIEPATAGTVVTDSLPTLVTGLNFGTGETVTLTYQAAVSDSVAFGDTLINTVSVTDTYNSTPATAQATIAYTDPCDGFPVSVATAAQLDEAIACYNSRTAAGQYTISMTADITPTAELTSIDNPTDGVQLLIDGNGFALDGDRSVRLLHIAANTVVTIDDVTIRNGKASRWSPNGAGGGGINSKGTLTVINSRIIDNKATDNVNTNEGAGGIDVRTGADGSVGTLIVRNSTFTGNDGSGEGGAIFGGQGSVVDVADSTFEKNVSDRNGGAIFTYGSLTVTNSDFIENEGGWKGGAVYVEGDGAMAQISGSTFHRNTADTYGGAVGLQQAAVVTIDNSDLISNTATASGGGALDLDDFSVLTVTNSSILNNRSPFGSAIRVHEPSLFTHDPSRLSISTSCIVNNDDSEGPAAIYIGNTTQVDTIANDNWWGHETGPNIELERNVFNGGLGDSADIRATIDRFETTALARCPNATREAVDLSHIEVEKTVYPSIADTYELITYTIRITNTGADTQSGLIALDDLPPNVHLNGGIDYDFGPLGRSAEASNQAASPELAEGREFVESGSLRNGNTTFNHDIWFWPVHTLNPGQSVTITMAAQMLAQGDQTLINTALVTTRRTPNPVTDTADVNYTDTCDVFPATVTDTNSLHEAILCFNARQTPGTYEVSFGNSITLDAAVASIWNPSDGVALYIDGNGFTLDGDERYRGFNINDGDVTIDNLTIQNGHGNNSDGGGIRHVNGTLMLTNSTLTNNFANRSGGGIVVFDGTVTISNTQIISNFAYAQHQAAAGGGLSVLGGNVTVQSSDISHNVDTFSRGGGVYLRGSASLAIADSRIANNRSPGAGGIFMRDWSGVDPHLTLLRTTVEGNDGYAGGLRAEDGFADIIDSTFSNNISESGGAIYNEADVTIVNSTISGNQGIDLDNSREGGGVRGGGTVVAGIRNEGTITLTHVTIVNNHATSNDDCCIDVVAGGFYNRRTATLQNVLLADNVGEVALDPIPGHLRELGNCHLLVAPTIGADTMADDDSCGGATQVADAMVGPLADNGPSTSSGSIGAPQTHALLPGSPAIDAIMTMLTTDQRGMLRPADGNGDGVIAADVGAYEKETVGPINFAVSGGGTITEPDSGTVNMTFTVTRSHSDNTGAIEIGFGGTATLNDDYIASTTVLTFPIGTLTQTVTVAIVGDVSAEFPNTETVTATLSNVVNGVITVGEASGTIIDNDNTVPAVVATNPMTGAVDVSVYSTIVITFDEAVSLVGSLTLICDGAAQTVMSEMTAAAQLTVSVDGTLPAGEQCALTVPAVSIADVDPTDPANSLEADFSLTFTTAVANALASETLLVHAFTYQADGFDGHPTGNSDGFIVLKNVSAAPVSLAGHKLGDEETQGGDEGMYLLPDIELAVGALLIIAEDADLYAFDVADVDYSFAPNSVGVPTLTAYAAWSSGSVDLDDRSDEIVLLDGNDAVVDGVCYGVTHEVCVVDTTASTREQEAARAQILLLQDGRLPDSADAAGYTRQSDTDTNTHPDFMLHPTAVTLSEMATSTDRTILLWVPVLLLATAALVRRETMRLEQPKE